MSYSVTTTTITGTSGEEETVVVAQDTTGGSTDFVALAVDYSAYFSRIATAVETIATAVETIATQLTPATEEAQSEVLADQIARLRYLMDPNAEEVNSDGNNGTGARITQPYSPIINALTYESLIKNGKILEVSQFDITANNYLEFLSKISSYYNNDVQKEIDPEHPELGTFNVVKAEAEARLQNIINDLRTNPVYNSYK